MIPCYIASRRRDEKFALMLACESVWTGGWFEEIKPQSAPREEVMDVAEGFYCHMVVIEDGSSRQTE